MNLHNFCNLLKKLYLWWRWWGKTDFNTKWKIAPSILFVDGKGPCVPTFQNWDNTTKSLMVHNCLWKDNYILKNQTNNVNTSLNFSSWIRLKLQNILQAFKCSTKLKSLIESTLAVLQDMGTLILHQRFLPNIERMLT